MTRRIRAGMHRLLYFERLLPSIAAMGGDLDHSDFVDPDFDHDGRAGRSTATVPLTMTPPASSPSPGASGRPLSREEIDKQVTAAQQALVELKAKQEDLERERAQLEEARRRRLEYQQGREEMLVHLTRGTGLLTELEQATRSDAEQLARTLADLRAALDKVSALDESAWSAETYHTELTRALTTLENARMEWNSARARWPTLNQPEGGRGGESAPFSGDPPHPFRPGSTPVELARLGLALTWPVALAVVVVGLLLAFILARR